MHQLVQLGRARTWQPHPTAKSGGQGWPGDAILPVAGLATIAWALAIQPPAQAAMQARLQETLVAGIAVWGRADQVAWHIANDLEERPGCLGLAVLELPNQVNPYDAAKHALPLLIERNGLAPERMPWSDACSRASARRTVYVVSLADAPWDGANLVGAEEATESIFEAPILGATLRVTVFPDQDSLTRWMTNHCDETLRRTRASFLDGGNAWQWWDSDLGIPWGADGWRAACIEQEGTP